jgi:CheY-like chemotaxis protein
MTKGNKINNQSGDKDREAAAKSCVLLIEDEEVIRKYISNVLTSCGLKVFVAKDGQDGIDTFRQHADQVDVVLLDYRMPGLTAAETLTGIRQIRSDIEVIVSSGLEEQEVMPSLGDEPVTTMLKKPYRLIELINLLNELGLKVSYPDFLARNGFE